MIMDVAVGTPAEFVMTISDGLEGAVSAVGVG